MDETGLECNFDLIKNKFGDICYVREIIIRNFPQQKLMDLFMKMNYKDCILLECLTDGEDKVNAIKEKNLV